MERKYYWQPTFSSRPDSQMVVATICVLDTVHQLKIC